ncbi:MAG: hypothetical protein ACE5J6_02255 [Candidatus Bathyarchaeia archaeon]
MRRQWVGKNVDLALLSERLEDFFKSRGFKTRKDELADGYTISVASQNGRYMRGDIDVRIVGNSNDFVIEFFAGERARSSMMLGFITTILGGGSLILRGLRSQEALEKLEREFWVCAEDSVVHLASSVGR